MIAKMKRCLVGVFYLVAASIIAGAAMTFVPLLVVLMECLAVVAPKLANRLNRSLDPLGNLLGRLMSRGRDAFSHGATR